MVFLQKHPCLSLHTSVPSFRKGATGARAPKFYRLVQHRCTTPLVISTTQLDPLRRWGFGATERPFRTEFLSQLPNLSSHGPRDDAGKSGTRGGRWQSVICCRCAAGVECFDGARDLTSQASLTSHTDHCTSPPPASSRAIHTLHPRPASMAVHLLALPAGCVQRCI
jgi:hypothetical protein